VELSEKIREAIEAENATLPRLRSGLIPALHRVHQAYGEISDAHRSELAEIFEMGPDEVAAVVQLSKVLDTPRRGRHLAKVCVGLTCSRDGAREFLRKLAGRMDIPVGGITEDGRIELGEEICFGACAAAPMMWLGDEFHEDLDVEEAMRILAALE